MNLIKGKAGGFFSPQEEGGACKITIIFKDRDAQDAAFLLRGKDVVIGIADDVDCTPENSDNLFVVDRLKRIIRDSQAAIEDMQAVYASKEYVDSVENGLPMEVE